MYSKAGVNNTFNQSELKDLEILKPPLPEQSEIASVLESESSKIDGIILKTTEAIGKLQEYRMAIISAAVTGQIDVRNHGAA